MVIGEEQVRWSAPAGERHGRPWLVLLHGHGMDESIGFDLRHRLPPSLVLASLRGPLRVRAGYGWFSLDPQSFDLAQVDAAVEDVLSWLGRQTGYRSLGILGFSQGSAIAVECLRLRPELFACAVLLSGFLNPLPRPGDPGLASMRPPVFSGRGDADRLVPGVLTTLTDTWLRGHTRLEHKVYPGLGHNVAPQEIEDLTDFLRRHLPGLDDDGMTRGR
ncbi:MAG TPA: alpha/beta fold hydrolase, partial [Microlunatus sp.]|nr:alpha/beta fold hydrolase [Microlunatus sp.]